MAADIPEITDSNQEHNLADYHECLRILARLDRWMTLYEPILAQFSSPVAAYTATRRARKAAANGNGP